MSTQVEFKVNSLKQNYAMKLGEGGEAFFVFETSDDIPESLQTSPVVSPATSPRGVAQDAAVILSMQEPDFLDISAGEKSGQISSLKALPGLRPGLTLSQRTQSDRVVTGGRSNQANKVAISDDSITPASSLSNGYENPPPETTATTPPVLPGGQLKRSASADAVPLITRLQNIELEAPSGKATSSLQSGPPPSSRNDRPHEVKRGSSPPPLSTVEAVDRAKSLSKELSSSNISSCITESGDLMLDMTGYKSSEEKALRAESIARKILAEELEGNYDIGALIGADMHGNLWIYSSEEAKEAAQQQIQVHGLTPQPIINDAASDPGYQSDGEPSTTSASSIPKEPRTRSEVSSMGLMTPAETPPTSASSSGDPSRNYAKTLRLTSEQLKALDLKPGPNTMSFSVNRATCSASMYYWTYDIPIVISDIDGTITK
ncbi:MAG: hypothetical protein LQ345_006616 [Seirophora villosa]|nr:MAG: hypothetical protein LQ345_006616 [Seirophora villosa]